MLGREIRASDYHMRSNASAGSLVTTSIKGDTPTYRLAYRLHASEAELSLLKEYATVELSAFLEHRKTSIDGLVNQSNVDHPKASSANDFDHVLDKLLKETVSIIQIEASLRGYILGLLRPR